MNANTKLEIAVEIMAAKIAKTSREENSEEKLEKLLKEKTKMYQGDKEVIEKIINVYQWKRSKGVKCYVHIPHYVGDFSDYRMFGLDYYDAVLASGENQIKFIRKIEELRPSIKHKEVVLTGSICLDNLKKKVDSSNKIQNTKPVVLLL